MSDTRAQTLGKITEMRDFLQLLELDVRSAGYHVENVCFGGAVSCHINGKSRETFFRFDALMLTDCVDALERELLEKDDPEDDDDEVPTWFLLKELAIRAGQFLKSPIGIFAMGYALTMFLRTLFLIWLAKK